MTSTHARAIDGLDVKMETARETASEVVEGLLGASARAIRRAEELVAQGSHPNHRSLRHPFARGNGNGHHATGAAKLAAIACAGAGLAYLLDPDNGRSRRARLQDQLKAMLRRGGQDLSRRARYERGRLAGVGHRLTSSPPEAHPDDHVLLDRIRSRTLGKMPDLAAHVSVDVSDGVVTLRGELEDRASVERLGAAVADTLGVERVVNLVHLPGESAPNKADALRASV